MTNPRFLFGSAIATLVFCCFMNSCSTTTTSIQALRPAAFAIPSHINTVATVNRSIPKKNFINGLEGMATGENLMQDRSGAANATRGLSEALTRTPRFNVKYTQVETANSDGLSMGMPMEWSEVNKICEAYSTDAVAALELLDSDTRYATKSTVNKTKDSKGNDVTTTTYQGRLDASVRIGWRLYDPNNKKIIDELVITENIGWDSSGKTEQQALAELPPQQAAIDQVCFAAGQKYGMRIAPTWIRIGREYYHKGSDEMKNAARKARSNQWQEAAKTWQPLTQSADKKIAQRASYNMAVACEVEGKLDLEKNWAKESWQKHGSKKARTYYHQLCDRSLQQKMVDDQMNGGKPKSKVKPAQ